MRRFKLLTIAERELLDSARFYNQESAGVGDRLVDEFLSVMERLCRHPESGARISKRLRVTRFRQFPYSVVYKIEDELILVVAVAHQSRRPGYWKGRI